MFGLAEAENNVAPILTAELAMSVHVVKVVMQDEEQAHSLPLCPLVYGIERSVPFEILQRVKNSEHRQRQI
jgi:hypothetical protein